MTTSSGRKTTNSEPKTPPLLKSILTSIDRYLCFNIVYLYMNNILQGVLLSTMNPFKKNITPQQANIAMNLNPQSIRQLKGMAQLMQASHNPQQLLASMANGNPQLHSIMDLCKGKSAKDVFYDTCKQRGIDPESIISQFR